MKLSTLTKISLNTISENATLKQALEKLDKVLVKVLFVMKEDMFTATLTDGDVRRAILAGASLNTLIMQFANYKPLYLKSDDEAVAKEYLQEVTALPVVDAEYRILKVYIKEEQSKNQNDKLNLPVVIMAGGKGMRLYPYTKILPKPLIPIIDIDRKSVV